MSWIRAPGPGGPVTLVASSYERVHAFVVRIDGTVFTTLMSDGEWTPVGTLTVAPCAPITAVSRGPGLVDAFAVGRDGQVYTAAWDASKDKLKVFREWRPTDPTFRTVLHARIEAIAPTPGILILFAVGRDGRIYMNMWPNPSGSWMRWQNITTSFLVPPGAPLGVAYGGGKLDMFVVDTSRNLRWRNDLGIWATVSSYSPLEARTPLTAVRRQSGMLNLFFTLSFGTIGYLVAGTANSRGGWTWAFSYLLTKSRAAITAAPTSDDTLNIFLTDGAGLVNWAVFPPGSAISTVNPRPIGFLADPGIAVGAASRYWNTVQVAASSSLIPGSIYASSWTFGVNADWTFSPWKQLGSVTTGMSDPETAKWAGLPEAWPFVGAYATVWSYDEYNGGAGATSDGAAWYFPFNDYLETHVLSSGTQRMIIVLAEATGLPGRTLYPIDITFPKDHHLGSPDYWEGRVYIPAYSFADSTRAYGVHVVTSYTRPQAGAKELATATGAKFAWCAINPLNGLLYSLSSDMYTLVAFDPNTRLALTRYPQDDVKLTYPADYGPPEDQQGGFFTKGGRVLLVFGHTNLQQHMVCFSAMSGRAFAPHLNLGRYGHTQETILGVVGIGYTGTEVEGVTVRKIVLPNGMRGDVIVSEINNSASVDETYLHLYSVPQPDLL